MLHPFSAAIYSAKNQVNLSQLIVSDLDTAEHLWGSVDSSKAFRNVLVGPPEQRGEIWHAWISAGDVELLEDDTFFVLRQSQKVAGRQIDRWALYAAIDVNEPSLFIHEDVFPEGVERARQGMESCESDMAPIFVGCDEGVGITLREQLIEDCQGREPLLHAEGVEDTKHLVWAVKNPARISQLQQMFQGVPLFLLDGHHRLAAAKENYRLGIGDGKILTCICSMAKSDTLILPIHRAVHYERWLLPDALFADLVRAGCKISELNQLRVGAIAEFLETHSSSLPHCVVQHSHSTMPTLVTLPVMPSQPPQLASLPVACLDLEVMGAHSQATVIPVSGPELALEQLALDQAQAVFFLPPASPAQVRAIALSQLKMPRKSTRFTPKPALGLLCRPWTASG